MTLALDTHYEHENECFCTKSSTQHNYTPIFLVLSHMFGYVEQKLLGRSWKLFFLNLMFSAVRNFKFYCRFAVPVIQIVDNIGSLGRFQWNFQIITFSCPSTHVPSYVEKYSSNKICHFWHWRQLDLCETSFLLLNGSHWNLKFSPT
jgi:hypothetical protein